MRKFFLNILGGVYSILFLAGLYVAAFMPREGINRFEDVRAISQQMSLLLALLCLIAAIVFFIVGNAKTAEKEEDKDDKHEVY